MSCGSSVPPRALHRPRVRLHLAPVLAILLVAGLAGSVAVDAAEPPAAAPDTTAPRAAVPDSVLASPHGLDSPTAVMFRSLLIPGWGQAKNGAWLKAIIVAGVEGAFLERIAYENRMANRYADRARTFAADDPLRVPWDRGVQRHRNHRRDFIWWTGLWVFLSMGDAYTDAHLKHFDVRLGEDPASSDARPSPGGLRVQLGIVARW